jgi:hypothetical protein
MSTRGDKNKQSLNFEACDRMYADIAGKRRALVFHCRIGYNAGRSARKPLYMARAFA